MPSGVLLSGCVPRHDIASGLKTSLGRLRVPGQIMQVLNDASDPVKMVRTDTKGGRHPAF